jgi:hypothetical protein
MAPVLLPKTPQEPAMSISSVVNRDIHALLVAINLLRPGFAVFRKLGRASLCDLLIIRGRWCWRVAVASAPRQWRVSALAVGSSPAVWRPGPGDSGW